MSSKRKVHFRDLRLFVNAGVRFPACKAHEGLLDMDATRLETSPNMSEVTCKACRRIMNA